MRTSASVCALCLAGLVLLAHSAAAAAPKPAFILKTSAANLGFYQVALFTTPLTRPDAQKACKAWYGGDLVSAITLEVPGFPLVKSANKALKADYSTAFWTGGLLTQSGSDLVGHVPLQALYANQFYFYHPLPKGAPALCFVLSAYLPAGTNNYLATDCRTKLPYVCEAVCNAANKCKFP